ncbi:MAG: YdcF family protein [Anaerolineae bacterium]|nr:YdcF family protein [Anaerolineae bacterium]
MQRDPVDRYDAILIPGGGLTGTGGLPVWVTTRLDAALAAAGGAYFIVLSAGTVHKPPPLDAEGFPVFEARAAAAYLLSKGVEPGSILLETCSYDTIGNAYFSRVLHVEPRQFRKLLVITSAFHAARTEFVFRWVYGLDEPAGGFELSFRPVPNVGMPEAVLAARVEKEKRSLEQAQDLEQSICTLAQLHEWLFTKHEAYAAGSKPQRLKGPVLGAY